MRTLRWASFWAIGTLAAVAAYSVQAKENSVKHETSFEIAHRLLGAPMREGEKLNTPDPAATTEALRALLAVSNAEIPASSSCQGRWRSTGKSTVKDLLATTLAYQYSGNNVIQGNCQAGQCAVIINHEAGESVSSTAITFNKVRGQASISTLQCVITP